MATTRVPTMYTIETAAALAGRTPKALRQLRARQLLGEDVGPRFRKIDGRILIADDDLAAWLHGDDSESTQNAQ